MKMTTRSLLNTVAIGSITTLAMAFGSVSSAQAATLVDENFDAVAIQGGRTGPVGSYLTVTAGDIDVIGPGFADFYPGNGNYIDLNGGTGGTLTSSTFTFSAGDVVNLSFDYAKNLDSAGVNVSADVILNGVTIGQLGNLSTLTPFSFSTIIGADTTGTLSFVSTNPGTGGVVLDNIKLTSTSTAAVPEPSDFVGTAIAFGSVVMLKRNFGKKAK
jgi:hypothetical protein